MNIDEKLEKSDFYTKSLTSIPFGGPIVHGPQSLKRNVLQLIIVRPSASCALSHLYRWMSAAASKQV